MAFRDEFRGITDTIHPTKFIALGLLIAALSLIWTLILPGIVAYRGGVFYRDDISAKLPQDARLRIAEFAKQQQVRRQQVAAIDSALFNQDPSLVNVEKLLQLRGHLEKEISSATPPISVIPFHLNPQLLLWPAIYTCLGWLIVVFKPPSPVRVRYLTLNVLLLAIFVYGVYEWPLWVRNFVLSNEGRTVYAYPNFDIHPSSFFTQEGVIFGFCLLLATLWNQWAVFLKRRGDEISSDIADPAKMVFDQNRLEELSNLFLHWQACSVILALGFLFFTNFFWTLVAKYHDQRYLLSAIMAHLMWGISWTVISLPLIVTWRHWSRARGQVLASIAPKLSSAPEDQAFTKHVLAEVRPLSGVSLSVSSIASFISFLLPLVQLFTK